MWSATWPIVVRGAGMVGEPRLACRHDLGDGGLRVLGEVRVLRGLGRRHVGHHLVRDEARQEDRHDHAAVGRDPTQDLVRDVAHVVGHRSGPGVREDHGRLGDVERGGHRRGRDVAEVDQHPEPVHLAHDLATERGQAVVLRRIGRGVGPARRPPVGERHVADAARVELAQGRHRARDHRPAFEPDQRRDPAGCEGRLHLVRRRRQARTRPG